MRPRLTKAALSGPRRRFVELMQAVGYGQIEGVALQDGEPIFDPPPRVVRVVRLGAENGPRPELARTDFHLKSEVLELFDYFDRIGTGRIDVIKIQHGLPIHMQVEGVAI